MTATTPSRPEPDSTDSLARSESTASPGRPADGTAADEHGRSVTVARLTGLAYLIMGLAGMLGFLIIRSQLYVPDDAVETMSALVDNEGLARLGLVLDLVLIAAQAVTALSFGALFRRVNVVAAGAVAAFGLVNAVAVMVGSMFSATALRIALDGADVADRAGAVLILYQLGDAAWSVGAVFFGLWLIPMGWLVIRSGWMPRPLGLILMVGGVGYGASAISDAVFDGGLVVDLLVIPAGVGEFWIIGYLLLRGVRGPERPAPESG